MRISFLIHNGFHYGGTVQTTFTLAERLAERHEELWTGLLDGRAPRRRTHAPAAAARYARTGRAIDAAYGAKAAAGRALRRLGLR
ncbi:hypothetical protein ACFWG5_32140 [Streptomyces hydrogenans]|uniref:hypothetical protein n=1 Tax=Streptomyces hydrogenans TaxID=1873719 RepID=UPI00365104F3